MYTVGLDVDTHSIMKNLAAGVLGATHKNYYNKNSSRVFFYLDKKKLEVPLWGSQIITPSSNYSGGSTISPPTEGLLNDYTSSEGLLTVEDFAMQEIEQISDHMKKHEKPLGEAEFGYYLAGLIEGSGYFGDQ
jgi:hypothetical protein